MYSHIPFQRIVWPNLMIQRKGYRWWLSLTSNKKTASAHRIDSHRDIQTKMIMAQSTASLTPLLAMAMLASSAVAQTAPNDAVGTNPLSLYSISTTEWSNDVPADPEATEVEVTSAGSCVCDLTAGSCDGNCCCDLDCTVRLLSTPGAVPRPVVACLDNCRLTLTLSPPL